MNLKQKDYPFNFKVDRLPPMSTSLRDINICQPSGMYFKKSVDLNYATPTNINSPSWKLEKVFSPLVLTGNWVENRMSWNRDQFNKAENLRPMSSTYLADKSKAIVNKLKCCSGVPSLISKYMEIYNNNQISTYDEDYNQRWREKNLPTLRNWNLIHDAWIPEKSDHPCLGTPTQFGLLDSLSKKWQKEKNTDVDTYNTIYRIDFPSYPPEIFSHKHATCIAPFAKVEKRVGNIPCVLPHLTKHN